MAPYMLASQEAEQTSSPSAKMPLRVFGLGQPLVDLVAGNCTLKDLEPWAVGWGEAKLATEIEGLDYVAVRQQIVQHKAIEFLAGGATLNAVRVAQWIFTGHGYPNATSYIGKVGKDQFATMLHELLRKENVTRLGLEPMAGSLPTHCTRTCELAVLRSVLD